MTANKHVKSRARARAARTREPYATALRSIRQQLERTMPTDASPTTGVLASCSFCGKGNTEVQRLVAGAGVYICNECVEVAAWVIDDADRSSSEESSRRRAQFANPSVEEMLAAVPAMFRSAERIERELAGLVNRLRQRGTDWPTIAEAAGVPIDVVRQRVEAAAE